MGAPAASAGARAAGSAVALRRAPSPARSPARPEAPRPAPAEVDPGAGSKAALGVGAALLTLLLLIIAPLLLFSGAAAGLCGGADVPTRFNEKRDDPANMPALEIATRVYLVGRDMHMGNREILTAFSVVLVESGGGVTMRNVVGGSGDSTGAFQQRDIPPWNRRNRQNVAAAARSFFEALKHFDHGQPPGQLAADIQRPAAQYRGRYAAAMPRARVFLKRVEARVQGGGSLNDFAGGATGCAAGPANLKQAIILYHPRSFTQLPRWAMSPGRAPQPVDTRILPDVLWVLRTYKLRVNAAREPGHHTHGDGTAIDAAPASGNSIAIWNRTAKRVAEDMGWRPSCARAGSRPVCHLVPAIQFIGYNGYDSLHGDPAHSGSPHIHISWVSSSFGTSWGPPPRWVKVFPAPGVGERR